MIIEKIWLQLKNRREKLIKPGCKQLVQFFDKGCMRCSRMIIQGVECSEVNLHRSFLQESYDLKNYSAAFMKIMAYKET